MDAYMFSVVAERFKRDRVETFASDNAAAVKKTTSGGSVMMFVVMLVISSYAAYLSWTRNTLNNMKIGPRKILYAIVAFMYGLSYLISYAVFLRQTEFR